MNRKVITRKIPSSTFIGRMEGAGKIYKKHMMPHGGLGNGYDDYIFAAALAEMPRTQRNKLLKGGFNFGSFLKKVGKHAGKIAKAAAPLVKPALSAVGVDPEVADFASSLVKKAGNNELEAKDLGNLLSFI